MPVPLAALAMLSLLLVGAIFGFFYAWICSTMWGLDQADPSVAIAAMQAMNASVRNAVFAPAFFGTPPILVVTAVYAAAHHRQTSAKLFFGAALVYLVGGIGTTVVFNVPLNEALAAVDISHGRLQAEAIWSNYSGPWKGWNILRAGASGISLMLTGGALLYLRTASG